MAKLSWFVTRLFLDDVVMLVALVGVVVVCDDVLSQFTFYGQCERTERTYIDSYVHTYVDEVKTKAFI